MQAVVELRRIAPGEVGAAASVEEKRVPRDEATIEKEALATWGVSRRVEQADRNGANSHDVTRLVLNEIRARQATRAHHPRRLVGMHVYGHTGHPYEFRGALDGVPHHPSAHVVWVVVRRENAHHTHPLGRNPVNDSSDVIGGIDEDTFARCCIADCIDMVGHLGGDGIFDSEVSARQPLTEPHPLVCHVPRVPLYAGAMSRPVVVVEGHLVPVPDGWSEGDWVVGVSPDRLLVIPSQSMAFARESVRRAGAALPALVRAETAAIDEFYRTFAGLLGDDRAFEPVARANDADVADAAARGRATGRLRLDGRMRRAMVEALGLWAGQPDPRGSVLERVEHDGWTIEVSRAPLGVVGFVFEGRPNVFTDATGVLRGGNSCVFRIGSDALGTARAIMEHLVTPSLRRAGLPDESIVLLDDPTHGGALALMAQPGLSLAVARGSGPAVRDLGAVARQHGVPASLHGTGGAWMLICDDEDPAWVRAVVERSLDRKVCNTLNVACLIGPDATSMAREVAAGAIAAASARGTTPIVHLGPGVDVGIFSGCEVRQQGGDGLSTEWEWDERPEFSVVAATDLTAAIDLCNRWSPRFVVSVLTADSRRFTEAWDAIDAPFVGDGMTRWVDGQYALQRPELGLSNWEHGRLLGRGAILSGSDVFSMRYRVRQVDPGLGR